MKTLRKILDYLGLHEIRAQYTTLGAWTMYPLHVLSLLVLFAIGAPIILAYVGFTKYIEPLFFKPK